VWVAPLIITLFFSCALTCLGRLVSTCLGHWELCGYSYGYCSIMMVQPQHRMRFLFLYQRWVTLVLISANIFLKFQILWQRLTVCMFLKCLYVLCLVYSHFTNCCVFTFYELCCEVLFSLNIFSVMCCEACTCCEAVFKFCIWTIYSI